jgi:type II secretory pathway pseudopilin PulG
VAAFTLLEMLVVCAILGAALLLAPSSFNTFGARSRLSSASNNLLSELGAIREQATIDGFETRLEIGSYRETDGVRRQGTRFWYTNVPAKSTEGTQEQRDRAKERQTSRAQDRQWQVSSWKELPEGVVIAGVSLEAGRWEKVGDGDRTFQARYFPDGSIEHGFGVRYECMDIDTKPEFRTVTVLVNALTAEPASYEGLQELPRQRDASEFH